MAGTAIVMSITAPLVKFFGHGNEGRGYLITMTIYGIAAMCIFFLTFAMQPDVIDYSEYKKNASVAGLIATFQGFFVVCWSQFWHIFINWIVSVVRWRRNWKNVDKLCIKTWTKKSTFWWIFICCRCYNTTVTKETYLTKPLCSVETAKRRLLSIRFLEEKINEYFKSWKKKHGHQSKEMKKRRLRYW